MGRRKNLAFNIDLSSNKLTKLFFRHSFLRALDIIIFKRVKQILNRIQVIDFISQMEHLLLFLLQFIDIYLQLSKILFVICIFVARY